jgi:hypothetical protein
MIRFGLLAGAGLILAGQVGTAEAQVRYRHGYYAGGWGHSAQYGGYYRGSRRGPAFAAGLVGGALLGGILRAATAPAYRDPYTYSYGYNYAPPMMSGTTQPRSIRRATFTVLRRMPSILMPPPMRSVAGIGRSTATAVA